jgi:hypothetical protein
MYLHIITQRPIDPNEASYYLYYENMATNTSDCRLSKCVICEKRRLLPHAQRFMGTRHVVKCGIRRTNASDGHGILFKNHTYIHTPHALSPKG